MTRHSTLDPGGPVADAIAQTWWVMFWGATAIFIVVMALLAYALAREPAQRPRLDARAFVFGGGLVFPAVVLTALLVYGTRVSDRVTAAAPDPLRIEVTARQWWWEVHYPDYGLTLADEMRLPVGVPVEIALRSADVIHSLWIPSLAGKVDLVPGRVNMHRLEASQAGRFGGHCAEFCGLLHAEMKLTVIVDEPDAFAAWRESLAGEGG